MTIVVPSRSILRVLTVVVLVWLWLRLSSLAVILAFAIGAELGGVIGALVALPIAGDVLDHRKHLAGRPARA